jgi:PAS domain S-box-containing protein
MTETDHSLETEIESLRQRLEEAEELRAAISLGQVDAFVVGPSEDSKRVLMLSGAYGRYRQLVEDMQQGAVTVTRAGEIVFANHSFAALVQVAPPDLQRAPLQRYVAPPDRDKIAALLDPRAGEPAVTLSLARADGTELPVSVSMVTANDEFTTLLVTDRAADSEEAAAAVEAIRTGSIDAVVVGGDRVLMLDSAQAVYQAAIDRMQQGVLIIGPDSDITYANEQIASLLGTRRERLLGTFLPRLAPNGDQARLESILGARRGGTSQAEVRLRRADGEYVDTMVTVTAVADGRKMCLVSDLRLKKRHQASDERTRKFLGMLAHEFRNILSPIRNSVELLKRNGSLDPEARKALETIERHTARLVGLVDDLRSINPRE